MFDSASLSRLPLDPEVGSSNNNEPNTTELRGSSQLQAILFTQPDPEGCGQWMPYAIIRNTTLDLPRAEYREGHMLNQWEKGPAMDFFIRSSRCSVDSRKIVNVSNV